nr:hypothetical protein [uncultured Cohaesibacter sp.]
MNHALKAYAHFVALVLVLSCGWGLLAPTLVSAKSDAAFLLGMVVVVLTPVIASFFLTYCIGHIIALIEKSKEPKE